MMLNRNINGISNHNGIPIKAVRPEESTNKCIGCYLRKYIFASKFVCESSYFIQCSIFNDNLTFVKIQNTLFIDNYLKSFENGKK